MWLSLISLLTCWSGLPQRTYALEETDIASGMALLFQEVLSVFSLGLEPMMATGKFFMRSSFSYCPS